MSKKQSNNANSRTFSNFPIPMALGIKAFSFTGLTILLVQRFRSPSNIEGPDKIIYLTALLIALYFLIVGTGNKKNAGGKYFYGILSILVTAVGISGIEQHDPINGVVLSDKLWLGYGPYVLIVSIALTPFIYRLIKWERVHKFWKAVFITLVFVNLILVIPSIWQDSSSIIEPNHSEYVLNEMIAPSIGLWPYSDFIPQYQTFYGFALKPFGSQLSASQISNISLIGLTLLSFAALILGVFLAWHAIGRRSLSLVIGFVIPFSCLTQFPNRDGYLGSIATLLSGLPIRIFPGLILIGALVYLMNGESRFLQKHKSLSYLFFGALASLVSWQSQDFGVAAAVTCFIVLTFVGGPRLIEARKTLTAVVGFVLGFFIYPGIAFIAGESIHFSYLMFFSRQFGSGFGAERIRTPGPVLYILPLIILLLVSHGIYLFRTKKSIENSQLKLSSLVGFCFALWSIFGFTYYLNRSYASGQLQVLFLPISISIVALIGILTNDSVWDSVFDVSTLREFFSTKAVKNVNFAWTFPLSLIISLPLATLLLTPNPSVELGRISAGHSKPGWPKTTILDSTADAITAAKYAKANGLSIGFFGASSNYVEKESGVKSVSILNSPFDLTVSQKTVQVACDYIFKLSPDVLVVSDEGANLFQFEGKTLCNAYVQQDVPGVRSGHFAVKITK